MDLTTPWERTRPAAESRAPDASWESHGGSASRGGSSSVWPDASAEVLIGDSRAAVTSSSSSVDALPSGGTYALPTGGTGGYAGMGGSAGIVASTATMGGVVAPTSVTGGVSIGGTGGVIAPTSASGGATTGGMGGAFSFGGTFRFPTSMMGGFFFSSRVGGANGGHGGNAISTGGTGGSSSQTGGSSGAVSSGSSTQSCGGVVETSDPSVCWYLGAAGASCAQTCSSHGGVSPNAAKQVGTAAQGGSASKCENLFDLLGYKVSVYAVQIASGLGCHLKPSMALPHAWASSPDYNDNAWESEVRIVCGCVF